MDYESEEVGKEDEHCMNCIHIPTKMNTDYADDEGIRKAYLELVRQYSPEREPERFKEIVQAYEGLVRELYRLLGFAGLSYSADTQDQEVQALQARFRQVSADADNRTLFFQLWWIKLAAVVLLAIGVTIQTRLAASAALAPRAGE